MNIKDRLLLMLASLAFGWLILHAKPTIKDPMAVGEMALIDTIRPVKPQVIVHDVNGKTALFIGDSHTANHKNGWQLQLSNTVGFKMINASVLGKTTYWMLEQAVYRVTDKIDYCFIYGGANDMYNSHITPLEAVDNIKGIARICNGHGVKCVILTGFDPVKCTRTSNKSYAGKYSKFQELLMSEYMEGAQVIDTRVVARTDCWDGLCHMAPSGHKKIAEKVMRDLALQKI